MKNLTSVAIIPARSGSKSIPDKNIRLFQGKPLLAHSIEQALAAESIQRVIVSTDSKAYADVAREYGAEVPVLRPADLSGDFSTDLEVFQHLLQWLTTNEGEVPDICVHLRPTCPLRNVADIDAIVNLLASEPKLDSVRSVTATQEPPFKMWFRNDQGLLQPVCTLSSIPNAHSAPRQILPSAFLQNAAIDAIRSSVILEQSSMTGANIYGYVMDSFVDIDDLVDFAMAEQKHRSGSGEGESRTFCFDIDGVIATLTPENDYTQSAPRIAMITNINALYSQGHKIILNTARGSMTGIDWRKTTEQQLESWGVCYHELHLGKPAADYYIDDRMLPMSDVIKIAGLTEDDL